MDYVRTCVIKVSLGGGGGGLNVLLCTFHNLGIFQNSLFPNWKYLSHKLPHFRGQKYVCTCLYVRKLSNHSALCHLLCVS